MLSLTWCSLSVLLLAMTAHSSPLSSSSRAHLLQQQHRHQLLLQRAADATRNNKVDGDDAIEYDDFGVMPPFLENAYVAKEIIGSKGKRYREYAAR